MEYFTKKKTSYKTQSVSVLLIFGILTILGALESFSFLSPLSKAQFWLFGYLGYIWLFVIAFLTYRSTGLPNFKESRFLEKTLGIVIGVFALLVLQGLFFEHAGILGVAFNSVLAPIITPLGVFVLDLACFGFSAILCSGKSPKELAKVLVKDLREDLQQSKIPQEKITRHKQGIKNFVLRLKDFFTPPSKQDSKNYQEFSQGEIPQNTIQESPVHKSSNLPFAKTPNAPRALTLEELIEQSKNNPPPNPFGFNLKGAEENAQEDLVEDSIREDSTERLESETCRDFNAKEPFEEEIDELRQDIELPTREDNPFENNSKELENAPQIRIVSPQEAKQKGFDVAQFQQESIASLENFKLFEQNYSYPNEESKEEAIRLIKKEELNVDRIAQNDFSNEYKTQPQDSYTNQEIPQDSQNLQDSTATQTPKPKPIKAYPKNLYAATPFSAYYDKKPVGTLDCLVQENAKNVDYPQDSSKAKESRTSEPSTIFYYGNLKSTRPIQAQEMQQIAQERAQTNENQEEVLSETSSQTPNGTLEEIPSNETLPQEETKITETISESPNEIPLQAESPTLNHIIRQVIQEFMESQPKQSPQDSKNSQDFKESESWEEAKDKMQEEAQNSNIDESLMQNPSFFNSAKATEIAESEIPYIQPFVANNIPNYGYMPTPQNIPQEKMPTSEVISLFGNAAKVQKVPNIAQNMESKNAHIQNKTQSNTQSKNVESQALGDSTFKNLETKQDNLDLANESVLMNSLPLNAESLNHSAQTTPQNVESPQIIQSKALEDSARTAQATNAPQNIQNAQPQSVESQNIESQGAESKEFVLPKLEFLQAPKEERIEIDEGEIDRKINDLLSKLRMFKIEGDIVRTYSGPIVTTFEFRPSPNVKVSRILTLQDDLAMALRAKTIRIQAPVPGKDVVGIEIPNNQIETIYLREILENELFVNSTSPLTLALGKDIVGNPFVTDLKKLPHLLIAGTTGSGKSVGINAMILSLLYKNSPKQLKLIMIDPKMLEFSIYNEIPHLLTPVITQPKKAIIALDNTVKEMERRYALMSEARIKNIEGYNQKAEVEGFEPFPYIVVIIDELADLMMSGGKEAEVSISRLAQMARASGIHLIVATQRPSVDVVTGLIKANLPSRISYKVGQKIDSKVILDSFGAESLLGRGDMLFTPPGGGIVRLHAPWSTENEIEKIVEFIKSQCPPQYDENFMPNEDEVLGLRVEGETDELYEEAKRIILNDGKTSISYIQRRLGIGYNKAANIIEQMQARGFLSEPNSKGVREILGD